MKYREFGNTGMKVSEIGFGAWAIGGNAHGNSYGNTADKTSLDALKQALDAGCNFIDTADVYGFGHSEELIGRALKGHRDRVILATKVGGDFYHGMGRQNFSPEYIAFALEESLKRLKTDYIDVYQLHNPSLKLIEKPETYATLKKLKRDGKIRAWGISIFDPVEGITALKMEQPDCLQVVYNIFSEKAAEELFPYAQKHGCAIVAREPLANGFLSSKYTEESTFEEGDIRHDWPASYIRARIRAAQKLDLLLAAKSVLPVKTSTLSQFALQFALAHPAISVVIPGIKNAEQARENLAASDMGPLSATELAAVQELAARNFEIT